MATMTRSRLADRLKSLGISCGQFDVYCEFKSDTTRNALRRDSFTDVPELADEKLDELEDEQERLALAATDVVLTDLEEGKDNLIFVPYFKTQELMLGRGICELMVHIYASRPTWLA